jgi:hypothetical protein
MLRLHPYMCGSIWRESEWDREAIASVQLTLVLDGGRCSGRGRSIGPGKRGWTAVCAEEDWRRWTAQDSGDDDGDWKRSTPATTGEEAPSDRVGKGRTAEATAWQERSAAAPCPNPIRALACRLCLHLADRFRSDTDTLDHLPLNETTGYAKIRERNRQQRTGELAGEELGEDLRSRECDAANLLPLGHLDRIGANRQLKSSDSIQMGWIPTEFRSSFGRSG